MFRDLRRIRQLLTNEESVEILKKTSTGILAVNGDDGFPYTVPLCYAYNDGYIYFHSAIRGHKIDAIKNDDKVSFCVVSEDNVLPEKLTTLYKSVVVFGNAEIIENEDERQTAMLLLSEKYAPEFIEKGKAEAIQKSKAFFVVKIKVINICGKQSIELVKKS